jgi:hypothetical protein
MIPATIIHSAPSESSTIHLSNSNNTSVVSLVDDECIPVSNPTMKIHQRCFFPPPTIDKARVAAKGLEEIIRPHQDTGPGHKDSGLDMLTSAQLEMMRMFLNIYISDNVARSDGWIGASLIAATAAGKGQWLAHRLRKWSRAYIKDPKDLPINPYETWNVSMLVSDEDLAQDIALHLQSLGQYISAQDIVHYLDTPEMKTCLGLKKTISHKTAVRWMQVMAYRWGEELKGQYADGHERDDVVTYQQSIFLPAWAAPEANTHKFDNDGALDGSARLATRPTVIWNHDESIFYTHDRRKLWWIHSSETAKPYAKGEGTSLMVADYVSPDYSWLQEPNGGGPGARVLLRPGKERDGYFTCDGVLTQASKAMDLLDQYYPNEDHIFIYDNVTTHKSGLRMPFLCNTCQNTHQSCQGDTAVEATNRKRKEIN